jgi:signal transduction histidine kinase/DNA-binding response OmpR family regulator
VQVLLTSRFSMWMAWGPELTFFCNDAYRRDTLGTKYPWALGRPASEVWAEIWDDIGPRIDSVMETGVATWDQSLMLFLERSGYVEETYHTFSYSPLTDDDGVITGMLCVVREDTDSVVGERRMRTLRDLGTELAAVHTESQALDLTGQVLAYNRWCLPFALVYLSDDDGTRATLAGSTGTSPGSAMAPTTIAVRDTGTPWPASEALAGEAVLVDLAGADDVPTGAWTVPPTNALVVPLPHQGDGPPYGFLVAGLNPHRPVDEGYRGFVTLIAGQVASSIATGRAYAEERRRAEELAELDRAKTAFFTNISHEFRTPLTLLLGPAEDALADEADALSPAQRQRVEVVHRNGQRLLKLVNTLLDFSRLECGRVVPQCQPTDLTALTADLTSMFGGAFRRAGLSLATRFEPLPELVHVDREMWAKIVLNLLSNALKFTFEGGVEVALEPTVESVRLVVRDTGTGIDDAEQARLFERFHRVPGARSRTHEGSGIGLALVGELAALHRGTVGVESAVGRGTTFTVAIPFGTAHVEGRTGAGADDEAIEAQARGFVAEAMRWLGSEEEHPVAPARASAGTRVLVVDDNADMRHYVAILLSEHYDVTTAPDGMVALDLARQDPPDLVLTDVMMPNLDGFGLLAALRANPRTVGIPVVMLSARADDDGAVEGLEAGADDYLAKPFSTRELLARVRANLELDRSRRMRLALEGNQRLLDRAQALAHVGSWELDIATGAIHASDELVRQVQMSRRDLEERGLEGVFAERIHPDDLPRLRAALADALTGSPVDLEVRIVTGESTRTVRTIAELERDETGAPLRLHGSSQDITDQRETEKILASAMAAREVSAREHQIADELQRSLLPTLTYEPEGLDVATYYRAGTAGTRVGGDWYDVIELGAGRTALVLGDVMGRGVRAAAVMGQLRSAIRAYARLDLPPADVLEFLDGVVRELGDDHIVTCIYAVYEPAEQTVTFANAGHLPPVVLVPGEPPRLVVADVRAPLGTGPLSLTEEVIALPEGATIALFTDGLIERRDRDLGAGITALLDSIRDVEGPFDELPDRLVTALVAGELDDDVAVLVARARPVGAVGMSTTELRIEDDDSAVSLARSFARRTLAAWSVAQDLADDVILCTSELVTNAIRYGRPPLSLRLRRAGSQVVLEVHDAATFLPRRLRPTLDDEHGRGLQLVSALAARYGARPTMDGKSVWAVFEVT